MAGISTSVAVNSAGIIDGSIVNADINASAAIDATKIADGSVSSTEFQHISTLSSNAQTQLTALTPEVGTFAPTIVGTSTAGAGTYTTQVGWYTKKGNTVFWRAKVTISAHTGTGDMNLGNLPFTSANTADQEATVYGMVDNLTLIVTRYFSGGYIAPNTNQVLLTQGVVGGGSFSFIAMDTAFTIWLAGNYTV